MSGGLIYKKRIREGQDSQTSSYTNDLHDALLNKTGQALWQSFRLMAQLITLLLLTHLQTTLPPLRPFQRLL